MGAATKPRSSVRSPRVWLSDSLPWAGMMVPLRICDARLMFVTRGSPGEYGVVKEPTSSWMPRACAFSVVNTGFWSAYEASTGRSSPMRPSATCLPSTSRPSFDGTIVTRVPCTSNRAGAGMTDVDGYAAMSGLRRSAPDSDSPCAPKWNAAATPAGSSVACTSSTDTCVPRCSTCCACFT